MPTYQYACKDCHHQFELFQKFSEEPLTVCPTCEGSVRRVIQNVGVVFKGSGWYINDSRPASKDKTSSDNGATEKAPVDTKASEKPAMDAETNGKPEKPAKSEKAVAPAPASTT